MRIEGKRGRMEEDVEGERKRKNGMKERKEKVEYFGCV